MTKRIFFAAAVLALAVAVRAQERSLAELSRAGATLSTQQAAEQAAEQAPPCNWWVERAPCTPDEVEGLPPDAPRIGTLITVDADRNLVYLFQDGKLLEKAKAATGTEGVLKHGLTTWAFHTPRGLHRVQRKVVNPVWVKPDWAFVEEGKKIPPANSPKRKQRGKMGKYALDLGEGILIHGTDDPSSVGKKASHGCIRLGDKAMKNFFKAADVGTPVYIF